MLTYTPCITKSQPEGVGDTVLSLSGQIWELFPEMLTNEAVLFADKTMKEQCMNSDFSWKSVCVCVCKMLWGCPDLEISVLLKYK